MASCARNEFPVRTRPVKQGNTVRAASAALVVHEKDDPPERVTEELRWFSKGSYKFVVTKGLLDVY